MSNEIKPLRFWSKTAALVYNKLMIVLFFLNKEKSTTVLFNIPNALLNFLYVFTYWPFGQILVDLITQSVGPGFYYKRFGILLSSHQWNVPIKTKVAHAIVPKPHLTLKIDPGNSFLTLVFRTNWTINRNLKQFAMPICYYVTFNDPLLSMCSFIIFIWPRHIFAKFSLICVSWKSYIICRCNLGNVNLYSPYFSSFQGRTDWAES